MAGLNGTTSALRPRGEVAVQLSPAGKLPPSWRLIPGRNRPSRHAMHLRSIRLTRFRRCCSRRPARIRSGLHEELAIDHAMGKRADLIASVFHDLSTHTAVIGRGGAGVPDFLQDYFSEAFAYDGGSSSSRAARACLPRKITDNLTTTIVYAYAGRARAGRRFSPALARGTCHAISPQPGRRASRPPCSAFGHEGYGELQMAQRARGFAAGPLRRVALPSRSLSQPGNPPAASQRLSRPYGGSGRCRQPARAGLRPRSTSDGSVVLVPSYRYLRGRPEPPVLTLHCRSTGIGNTPSINGIGSEPAVRYFVTTQNRALTASIIQ